MTESLSSLHANDHSFPEATLAYAASRGLLIIASAGDEPTSTSHYPAANPSLIGVGAVDPQGRRWEKSK